VRRSGGTISLEPVMHLMGKINENIGDMGTTIHHLSGSAERQASESAIVRLKQEIEEAKKEIEKGGDNTGIYGGLAVFMAVCVVPFYYWSTKVDEGARILLEYVCWFFGGMTLLLLIAMFAELASVIKKNKVRKAALMQKEDELKHHYQVVSQTPK
jgi:UDP-N-acetylmuramyl pentapeptide phosphotransferase/UDP-N-acetylglucosamine-1-phosphate transferase